MGFGTQIWVFEIHIWVLNPKFGFCNNPGFGPKITRTDETGQTMGEEDAQQTVAEMVTGFMDHFLENDEDTPEMEGNCASARWAGGFSW